MNSGDYPHACERDERKLPDTPTDREGGEAVRQRDLMWAWALHVLDSRDMERVLTAFNGGRPHPDPALRRADRTAEYQAVLAAHHTRVAYDPDVLDGQWEWACQETCGDGARGYEDEREAFEDACAHIAAMLAQLDRGSES